MFLRTLNVIIISALITGITTSATTPADVIKKFAVDYNKMIRNSSLYKEDPEFAKLFELPQKNALIQSNSISKNLNHSSKASRLVRDAVLASLISNFFISRNNSLVDYCIGCPTAVMQSLFFACLASNLFITTNPKLGFLILIAGQNALQIEIFFFKAFFKEPRKIFDDFSWRAALSCFFRTWYPITQLLNLDVELNGTPLLQTLSKKVISEDYFSTPNPSGYQAKSK